MDPEPVMVQPDHEVLCLHREPEEPGHPSSLEELSENGQFVWTPDTLSRNRTPQHGNQEE